MSTMSSARYALRQEQVITRASSLARNGTPIVTYTNYYAARYYDPYIGRFTQRDPIGDGVNWYTYTYNNPLKYTDPNGLQPVKDQAGKVGVFTGEMDTTKREVGKQVGDKAAGALRYLGERGGLKPAKMGPLTGDVKGRYVYTTKKGWVDMSHFLFYAGRAMIHQYEGKENPLDLAVAEGYAQEVSDSFCALRVPLAMKICPATT